MRLSTLDALCAALRCQRGDVLRWGPSRNEDDEDVLAQARSGS